MILTVDVGNSNIVFGLLDNKGNIVSSVIESDKETSQSRPDNTIYVAWDDLFDDEGFNGLIEKCRHS